MQQSAFWHTYFLITQNITKIHPQKSRTKKNEYSLLYAKLAFFYCRWVVGRNRWLTSKQSVSSLAATHAKAHCFTHRCFCAVAANISEVGNGINVTRELVLTSWALWQELRLLGVCWPDWELPPWQNPFCAWQTLRVSTCPKSTGSPSSPWMECLSWSSRRRGNSKGCYTSVPLHLWRCPLHCGSLVSAQGPFWQGRERLAPGHWHHCGDSHVKG